MHQLESDLWIGPANRTWKKECLLAGLLATFGERLFKSKSRGIKFVGLRLDWNRLKSRFSLLDRHFAPKKGSGSRVWTQKQTQNQNQFRILLYTFWCNYIRFGIVINKRLKFLTPQKYLGLKISDFFENS